MANQKAQQIGIPFEAPINMNKNQTDIKQFVGYNDRNSPVYGGNLSPLYFKTVANNKKTIFDKDGNYYQLDDSTGALIKNGTTSLMTVNTDGFKVSKVSDISLISSITVNPMNVDSFTFDGPSRLAYMTVSGGAINLHVQYANSTSEYTYTNTYSDLILGSRVFAYNGRILFICAGYKTDDDELKIHVIDFNESTSTFSNFGYGDATTPISLIAGSLNSTAIINSDVNTTFYDMNGNTGPITSKFRLKFNIASYTTGGYLPISIILESDSDVISYQNSQISAVNLVIDYNNGWVRQATYSVPTPTDGYSFSLYWRYPNVLIDGTMTCAYLGPYTTVKAGTQTTIVPWAGIGSVTPSGTTLALCTTTAEYTSPNLITIPSSYHNNCFYATDGNNSSFFFGAGRFRAAFIWNRYNSVNRGYVFDSSVGLHGAGVTLDSYNNAICNIGMALKYGNFELLYNNNIIQGIGSNNHILLSDWTTVSSDYDICTLQNKIYYCDENSYYKVSQGAAISFALVENRYIVMNTTSALNCWDINKNKAVFYATDWNNRMIPDNGGDIELFGSYYTAQNASYTVTGDSICSLQLPISIVAGAGKDFGAIDNPIPGLMLEFYCTTNSKENLATNATYQYSVTAGAVNNIYYFNKQASLEGLAYEAAALNSNPCIFDTFISSYTNQDMVISVSGMTYPLKYYNNSVILLYSISGGLENVQNTFVIQGQTYAIVNNKIFKTEYSSGNLILSSVVVDVFGLQYVGASPYMSLFYSQTNRTIYSFTGDAILNFVQDANTISEIYLTAYNPSTYKFYLCTNNGLYIVSGNNDIASSYRLNITGIDSIWFTTQGPIVVTDSNIIYISYYSQTGYTDNKLTLSTCYYGAGNNYVGIIDCIYIRLYSENKENGTFTINLNTLTNEGCTNEVRTFNIKASDWDKLTNTFYIRYQPKNQRSVGTSINLTSDFPLASMSVSYSQDTTVQISNNNI